MFYKKAEGPYPGVSSLALQNYAPLMAQRDLAPDEKAQVEEGKSRWFPKLFQSYGTKPHEMMASPGKQGLLLGLLGALGGAGAGGLLGGRVGKSNPNIGIGTGAATGALAGGALTGIPSGILGYFARRSNNEDIEELMRRAPKGSTRRDLLADPIYQMDRPSLSSYGTGGHDFMPGLLSGLMMGNISKQSNAIMGYGPSSMGTTSLGNNMPKAPATMGTTMSMPSMASNGPLGPTSPASLGKLAAQTYIQSLKGK